MESIEEIIIKRINYMEDDILQNTITKLKSYNVNLFNNQNEFICKDFKNDFLKTYELLFENDIPVNGIRYQLADFMSIVQVVVGIRNFNKFIGE